MAQPPDREALLELWRAVTPAEYHEAIEEDPRGSFRLFEALAELFATLAQRGNRSAQASFYLGHATQSDAPASSRVRATADVLVDRTRDVDHVRFMAVGKARFRGVGGRTYRNTNQLTWLPDDPTPSKTIEIEAEFSGFAGNLDHIADPSGKLTDQDGDPDTAALDFASQSNNRTGTQGGILPVDADNTTGRIRDSGAGDRLQESDVGLYVRIDDHPDAANVGRVLRIEGFGTEPLDPLTGLARRVVLVDDGPQRRPLLSARADDGGVFTDETAAANESTADDMTLLPAAPVVADAYYFGSESTFGELTIDTSQPGIGTYTITWEYWDGSAWTTPADLMDGTLGFRQTGPTSVTFTIPGDWTANTVDGVLAFHLRARLSAFTALTQQPLGRQAFTFNGLRLVNTGGTDGDTTWSVLDWGDLGFRILDMEAPSGGRDDDLFLMGQERGLFQQSNETDVEFRQRAARLEDVITPGAIGRAVNRALEPFGFRGEAIDVQNGLTGFFFDVDAFDYYETGDTFPTDPWKLFLSEQEAFGWFLVVVPWLGFGDFGMFYDEGPILFLDGPQEYIGPAFDSGFYDGAALSANASYAALHETVDKIRAGLVGFTMTRDERLNAPEC